MKRKTIKNAVSMVMVLALMLGLFAVPDITVQAEEELPTGLEKPIVEYKEVTEEEFNKAIAESKSASENVYNEYVYGESAYKGTDSFWSQFSKPYYDYSFSRLSDSQKSLYYNLYQELYSMIEGGVDLTDNASDDKGKRHYLTNPVFGSGLSKDDAMEVAYLIAYNAPEFYFVSQYISIVHDGSTGRYGVRMGVYDGMQSGSSRSYYAFLIKSKINEYLNQVSTSLSAYDKEKKIHDLLIDNCHYGSSNTSYSQSCASAFLNPGGETVCAGYSEAFALLCYARGIPVISITSSDHEWCQVQLGNYWYAVDVTHDDANGSRYRYFNKSDNTMLTLGRAAHTIEGFWSSVGRESCPYDYGSEHHGDVSSGICIGNHSYNNVSAGLAIYGANYNQLEYQWLGYDLSTGKWFTISNWQLGSNWVSWNPGKSGVFWLLGKARWADTKADATSTCIGIEHKQCISAKCQMPNPGWGGGWLIGISTFDNPNNSYRYEMLILDCNRYVNGDPNPWVYTTGRMNTGGGNTAWTIWQPQHGYYWTLFRIYDTQGNLLDEECYGFVA